MSAPHDLDQLAAAARLFGRLLLRELDAASLNELRAPAIAQALAALDVTAPDEAQLPELDARFFELFLHPDGALPPVQSLWRDGQYDGDAAVGVRALAKAAALEPAAGARGAPPDHLGCILLLWAETATTRTDVADAIAQHHLAWAELALQHTLRDDGFYGQVARATIALTRELRSTSRPSDSPSSIPS